MSSSRRYHIAQQAWHHICHTCVIQAETNSALWGNARVMARHLYILENTAYKKIISLVFIKLIKYFLQPALHLFVSHITMHTLQLSSPPKLDLSNPSVLLALKFLTLHSGETSDLKFVCYLRTLIDQMR